MPSFEELSDEQKRSVQDWLARFFSRYSDEQLTPARRNSLFGVAVRLAARPPSSSWGRQMHARKGGKGRQAKARADGVDPLAPARKVRPRTVSGSFEVNRPGGVSLSTIISSISSDVAKSPLDSSPVVRGRYTYVFTFELK